MHDLTKNRGKVVFTHMYHVCQFFQSQMLRIVGVDVIHRPEDRELLFVRGLQFKILFLLIIPLDQGQHFHKVGFDEDTVSGFFLLPFLFNLKQNVRNGAGNGQFRRNEGRVVLFFLKKSKFNFILIYP